MICCCTSISCKTSNTDLYTGLSSIFSDALNVSASCILSSCSMAAILEASWEELYLLLIGFVTLYNQAKSSSTSSNISALLISGSMFSVFLLT